MVKVALDGEIDSVTGGGKLPPPVISFGFQYPTVRTLVITAEFHTHFLGDRSPIGLGFTGTTITPDSDAGVHAL
jgi:hypothetical protein